MNDYDIKILKTTSLSTYMKKSKKQKTAIKKQYTVYLSKISIKLTNKWGGGT